MVDTIRTDGTKKQGQSITKYVVVLCTKPQSAKYCSTVWGILQTNCNGMTTEWPPAARTRDAGDHGQGVVVAFMIIIMRHEGLKPEV